MSRKIQPVSFKMDQDVFWKCKFILKKQGKTMSGFINTHLNEELLRFEKEYGEINVEDAKKALNTF